MSLGKGQGPLSAVISNSTCRLASRRQHRIATRGLQRRPGREERGERRVDWLDEAQPASSIYGPPGWVVSTIFYASLAYYRVHT